MRKGLDKLYLASGYLAACCLAAMLGIVVLQMAARWSGHIFAGGTNYAGYMMAASSFLAMAYALNQGAHIRVSIVLNRLGRHRRRGEVWCLCVSAVIALHLSYFAAKMVWVSRKLGDVSQGMDAAPLWIPQIPVALGAAVLAIALLDNTWRAIAHGELPRKAVGDADVERRD